MEIYLCSGEDEKTEYMASVRAYIEEAESFAFRMNCVEESGEGSGRLHAKIAQKKAIRAIQISTSIPEVGLEMAGTLKRAYNVIIMAEKFLNK